MTQKEIKSATDYDHLAKATRELLDGAFEQYEEVIGRIAAFVTETVVMPLHEKHGWGFSPGWAGWCFIINGQWVNAGSCDTPPRNPRRRESPFVANTGHERE